MSDLLENTIKEGKSEMEESIKHLRDSLIKIRTGKASTSMLNGVNVQYYGTLTPLSQVANVTTPDSKTISIQPWEKSILADIEKAIFEANLGLTPMNDGDVVRITIPPLTEERRKQLAKQVKSEGENSKVSLRNTRHKLMDAIRKEVKDGYPEDAGKRLENDVQDMVNSYTEKIDDIVASKENELMTV